MTGHKKTPTGQVDELKPKSGRGGPGRGGGRKLESGATAVKMTLTLDPSDIELFKSQAVGNGEVSRGIRIAAQVLREKIQRAEKRPCAI